MSPTSLQLYQKVFQLLEPVDRWNCFSSSFFFMDGIFSPCLPECVRATRRWQAPSCLLQMWSPFRRGMARCCHLRTHKCEKYVHQTQSTGAHTHTHTHIVDRDRKCLKGQHLPSYGPDIKAAPLSDVKKTKVLLSMPRRRSNDRIFPTLSSSSITASPYLQNTRQLPPKFNQSRRKESSMLNLNTGHVGSFPGSLERRRRGCEWRQEPSRGRRASGPQPDAGWSRDLPAEVQRNPKSRVLILSVSYFLVPPGKVYLDTVAIKTAIHPNFSLNYLT